MDGKQILVFDPYEGKYFYTTHEELMKKIHEVDGIYTGTTHCMLEERTGKPFLYLEVIPFKERIIKEIQEQI